MQSAVLLKLDTRGICGNKERGPIIRTMIPGFATRRGTNKTKLTIDEN